MSADSYRELLLRCQVARMELETALRTGRGHREALRLALTVLPELGLVIQAQERPLLRLRDGGPSRG